MQDDAGRTVRPSSRASNGALTCVVADDHPAVLAAVSRALADENVEVVGHARDGDEALAAIEALRPAIALLDVRMPGMTGIEVAGRLSEGHETSVILYTAYDDPAVVIDALDAGVRGFVLKRAPLDDLFRAIKLVAGGSTYIDAALAGALAASETISGLPVLTRRERDVLRLLAAGLRNDEIGTKLFISPFTVRNHVEQVMSKLEANSRTHAVATALRLSLIT
jgi:two-component system, NarL family, nitrate/nitrite response regulator NarL